MPIRVLEPNVAAQIAAGEVVERPASVAKELIENALDAGASRISIEVRGGGLHEIKVQDNGCGIPGSEVELAFERHATSKLRAADDLWAIATLGFRGEAMPSIASVAQVICVTRAASEELGTELRVAGGEIQSRAARGCSPGTTMSICDPKRPRPAQSLLWSPNMRWPTPRCVSACCWKAAWLCKPAGAEIRARR